MAKRSGATSQRSSLRDRLSVRWPLATRASWLACSSPSCKGYHSTRQSSFSSPMRIPRSRRSCVFSDLKLPCPPRSILVQTESLPPTISQPTDADATFQHMGRRQLVLLIIGIELGQLLTALDQTIVGTAAPRILSDLNGFSAYTWI